MDLWFTYKHSSLHIVLVSPSGLYSRAILSCNTLVGPITFHFPVLYSAPSMHECLHKLQSVAKDKGKT